MKGKQGWAPWLGALTMTFAVAVTGCSDDDSVTAPSTGSAFVRVAHLSPDAPEVDVWVDEIRVLQDVSFEAFSGYLEVTPGNRRVQVTPAGSTAPVVIDATLTLVEDSYSTVAATGLLGDGSLAPIVLTDDVATDAANAKIRFVHAGPDAPAVDITLADGTVLFGNVAFGQSVGFNPLSGGAYDLQVRAAGTTTVVLSFGGVPISNGVNYSVFAKGLIADGSLGGLVAVDAPGDGSATVELPAASSSVRVAHLSPDAPNVDVFLNSNLVPSLVDIPFGTVSGYLTVGAATQNVQVFVTGTTTNPVINADLTLLPGRSYTVAATGLVGQNDLTPIVLEDQRGTSGNGDPWVRFAHTSPDAPEVDIVVQGGPTLFSGVSFRESVGYDAVGAGNYTLEVRLSDGGALALTVPGVQLDPNRTYTAFAIGLAGNGSLDALLVEDTQ